MYNDLIGNHKLLCDNNINQGQYCKLAFKQTVSKFLKDTLLEWKFLKQLQI